MVSRKFFPSMCFPEKQARRALCVLVTGTSVVALSGCLSPTKLAVGAVSATVSAAGTVAGAAASAAGAGASAVGNAAGAALGSSGAAGSGSASTAAAGAAGLTAASQVPGGTSGQLVERLELDPANQRTPAQSAQLNATTDGVSACLRNMATPELIGANLVSKGYALAAAQGQSASLTGEVREYRKGAVRGSVTPSGGCSFQSQDLGLAMLKTSTVSILEQNFPGAYRIGSPNGGLDPCDGYTVTLGDYTAWISFTAPVGQNACAGPGMGAEVRVFQ